MSITAMNWVWQLRLRPSVKFVLLALADAADDDGECWPSITTLANKTCLDDRSVQRILRWLENGAYLQIARRYRKDGAPTSNRYRLALERSGDKLPPLTPKPCRDGNLSPSVAASRREAGGDLPSPGVADVTRTTTDPLFNLQQQPPRATALIFPAQFSAGEVSAAHQMLEGLDVIVCQQLLDELDGRLRKKSIRGSAISYLRTLVTRAKDGAFVPEVGIRIAEARTRVTTSSNREVTLAKIDKKMAAAYINKLRQALDGKGK